MSVTQIQNAIPGESLIGIEPELLQQVDPGWLHRLSLFSGRTLTATALDSEQTYRAGRLAILGQCVTQGTVKGLELSADLTAADPALQVTAGYGISASGEDVTLTRTLRTTLGSLQVIDPQTGLAIAAFPDYIENPANKTFAGVLLLQPVTVQASGATLDTGTGPILVSGNLNASCDQDPEEYAFEDWQIADGVRLVMVAWPSIPASLALPALAPAVSFRNRLAYAVFNAELALTPDDRLPWDMLGVPVAVVGFDATWKAQFVDRSTVVRTGGLARSRYVFPANPGMAGAPLLVQPALAQARVNQLTEQIGASPSLSTLVPAFALLPPCGVLPASAIDFIHKEVLWFPSNWIIQAGPVHQEEVESALLVGMTVQPLDLTQNESVEILVPLPDALYDPDVLVTETVAPAFQQAVDSATTELSGDLQHRKAIQQEANVLSQAITGSTPGPLYNLDAGLTATEIKLRDAQIYTPTSSEVFGTTSSLVNALPVYASVDYQYLVTTAGESPYTLTQDGNGNPLATPLPLFSPDDMKDMSLNGIQHFIDLINAKLSSANDLLDLAFLTAQSDVYRFRQYVLGATNATALAVSPIAAEIATGESAASTADNLRNYLTSILPASSPTAPGTATKAAPSTTPAAAQFNTFDIAALKSRSVVTLPRSATLNAATFLKSPTLLKLSSVLTENIASVKAASATISAAAASATFTPSTPGTVALPASTSDVLGQSPLVGAQLNLRTLTIANRFNNPPSQEGLFYSIGNRLAFLQLLADLEITIDDIPILVDNPPPPARVAGSTTITLVGSPNPATAGQSAAFTATVAGTRSTPPTGTVTFSIDGTKVGTAALGTAGEAVFSTANIVVGSHSITAAYGGDASNAASTSAAWVEAIDAAGTTIGNVPQPPAIFAMPTLADLRSTADPVRQSLVLAAVESPQISSPTGIDPDEASLFSTGIHVLEQHTTILRAVEGRIQQYSDFLTLCATALSNVQADLPQSQSLLTQLENSLAQARQDLAFTTALLSDETQRVAGVNAQRTYTLENYVQFVAFTRPRTLVTTADVPSRQLVPGNVTNPVPSCLQQSLAIPPELREVVALLREAPVNWLPSVEALLNKLERPNLLQDVAVDAQARAAMQLLLPLRTSSAATEPGVYAPVITSIYSANQQAFRVLQTQRAAFQPVQLVNQSWVSQVQILQNVTAAGDLISSSAVHSEVVNATARLLQQISSVATCLYARANQALPIDRLAWAEFLRGQGLTIELQSLAVLPNWNTQDYVSRQQMQMLVDWLFLQVDNTNSSAVAFISDVVRVSILLASDAPVNTVIAGAVTLATTPKIGVVIPLTLPSDRIAHGMYVQLYSSGVLTAQAVVTDLDSSSVRATVTQLYQTGVALQANDVAHFVSQPPETPALRAFDN